MTTKTGSFSNAATLDDGKRLTPEVCVIGSGAGGAVTAQVLARAGHEVLVVEEGGHRTRADFNMREDVAFRTLYQDGGARATVDGAIALLQGRTVGGTTVVNWTTCFRTPATVLDHWRTNFGTDFTTAELDPHWRAVEERLHVAEIPIEESNRNNRLLYDGLRAIGLSAAPTRRNVKRCMKSGYCGMGCPVDAKQSMLVTYLPDAVAAGAEVVYRLRVDRLETEAGRVARAHASVLGDDGRTPTGKRVVIEAKRFVVSAGALNSPALLLRSGLGGKGSPLGRRTFIHPVAGIAARYDEVIEPYYGAPQSVASHALAERGDKVGVFLEAAPLHPVMAALASSGMAQDHRSFMVELPRLAAHVVLVIDGFHPDEPGGTVTVRDSGAPALDYPIVPRVWEGLREGVRTLVRANLAMGAKAVRTSHDPPVEITREADLGRVDAAPWEPGRLALFSAHLMGGCTVAASADKGVVRPGDLRHHQLANLHVIDGSVFPTSLGVNPQLSIYGMAHLVASRLADAWKSPG
jgi:choline dehydrogenase-like flavoprotein